MTRLPKLARDIQDSWRLSAHQRLQRHAGQEDPKLQHRLSSSVQPTTMRRGRRSILFGRHLEKKDTTVSPSGPIRCVKKNEENDRAKITKARFAVGLSYNLAVWDWHSNLKTDVRRHARILS